LKETWRRGWRGWGSSCPCVRMEMVYGEEPRDAY